MRLSVLRRCCAQLPMPVAPNCAQMRPNQESKGSGFNKLVGAGDGNRTHVRSLGSFYSAIELRPPAASTQRRIASTSTGTQEMRGLCISKTPFGLSQLFSTGTSERRLLVSLKEGGPRAGRRTSSCTIAVHNQPGLTPLGRPNDGRARPPRSDNRATVRLRTIVRLLAKGVK